MLASGMSFRRLLRPYMVSALIIALATYVLNGFVIPVGNRVRLDFENRYIKSREVASASNIQIAIAKDTYLYVQDYDNVTKRATGLAVDQFKGRQLVSRLTAYEAVYDTLDQWKMTDFHIRTFKGLRATDTVGYGLDTNLRIRPSDFLVNEKEVAKMRNDQLDRYIERQKLSPDQRIFIYVGTEEADDTDKTLMAGNIKQAYIDSSLCYYHDLIAGGVRLDNLVLKVQSGAIHSEIPWSENLPDCLRFFAEKW